MFAKGGKRKADFSREKRQEGLGKTLGSADFPSCSTSQQSCNVNTADLEQPGSEDRFGSISSPTTHLFSAATFPSQTPPSSFPPSPKLCSLLLFPFTKFLLGSLSELTDEKTKGGGGCCCCWWRKRKEALYNLACVCVCVFFPHGFPQRHLLGRRIYNTKQ